MTTLIVGLGNPGQKYEQTRHNIGWLMLDEIAREYGAQFQMQSKYKGFVASFNARGEKVYLLKPTTFMNLSGEAVQLLMAYYKVPLDKLLVICDDVHLPFGKARLRLKGSSGGQKGIQSTIKCMGSDQFARLKLGVGPFPQGRDMASFVLQRFPKVEAKDMPHFLAAMLQGVDSFIAGDPDEAVHACNRFKLSD